MRPSLRAILLLLPYAALILWVTLGPVPWASDVNESPDGVLDWRLWLEPSTWTVGSEREFVLNVIMFVPLGALLAWALRGLPALAPIVVAIGFTLTIELLQIPLADRISDPRDLLANAAGAVIGVVVARAADAAIRLGSRTRQRQHA